MTSLALATALGAGGAAVAVVPAQAANRLVAHLQAPGHHPRAGHPWRIHITARTPSGRPVRAAVSYQFLFGGTVVAHRSHYRFRGSFTNALMFPARSVGYRLTFRAVVTSAIGRRNLDYWVQVRR